MRSCLALSLLLLGCATAPPVDKAGLRAILAILRDGEKGYDPAHPDKVYAGWKDAYWSSHGPDGMTLERTDNIGKQGSHEVFMRHRSPLMRVDLASIPKGSEILAARLVVIRNADKYFKEHPEYFVDLPALK